MAVVLSLSDTICCAGAHSPESVFAGTVRGGDGSCVTQ